MKQPSPSSIIIVPEPLKGESLDGFIMRTAYWTVGESTAITLARALDAMKLTWPLFARRSWPPAVWN